MRQLIILLLALSSSYALGQSLQTGIKQFEEEKYDQATKTLKAIKSKSPEYAEARFYLGRIAFDQEEFGDARDYFKEAYRSNDQVSKYYTWYGNATGTIAQSAGKLKQGMLAPKIKNAYEKATALDPGDMDAQWGLMEFYSQAPGVMGGSWEKALAACEAVYKIDPVQGHLAKATVYQRKEDFDLAEKEYIALAALEDRYLYNLGLFLQSRQKFEEAGKAFEEAWAKDDEAWAVLYQIGRTSALSGLNPDRGIECLELYMEKDRGKNLPGMSAARSRMAMIYEKKGDTAKARSLYEEALKQNPDESLAKDGLKRIGK